MKKFLELLFLQQLKGVGKALINKKYIDTLQAVEGLDACAEIVRKVNPDFDNDAINQAMVVAKKKFETITGYSDIHVITVFDEEYPSRLTLPQQGSFDLGYYHQTQQRYMKKGEK